MNCQISKIGLHPNLYLLINNHFWPTIILPAKRILYWLANREHFCLCHRRFRDRFFFSLNLILDKSLPTIFLSFLIPTTEQSGQLFLEEPATYFPNPYHLILDFFLPMIFRCISISSTYLGQLVRQSVSQSVRNTHIFPLCRHLWIVTERQ